ncbi:hypothetical protein P3T76_013864 [Phytophthora citrophthora]|uniref:Kazal-like domain-containing protein n=1 Tax=Phytophthora citrophthora TaxID=4793 RepID=A0AAD9G234_9STRA|nr:hypothetical protein P3T76_013864 [Phytophthora citrophthora]
MKLALRIVFAAIAVAAVTAGDPATLSTKEEATKTTKATKSEKTGTASSSGIGSLFEDGSQGTIGSQSAADATVDPKTLKSIGITVPLKDGSGGLDLGPGPAVYPSNSGSWDWSWDLAEGSASSTEASTAGSSKDDCPDACTMEYSPVTDENGKSYSNECAMRLAKCKGETGEKKKIVNFAVLDEPTVVKGIKEAETPATKTTKSTKSEKTGTASGSGIGSLFEDGSNGIIGGDSESGSADPTLVKGDPTLVKGDPTLVKGDPTLVKGIKEAETPATKTTKSTKSEKTGTASGSGIGSLFEDGSNGIIGGDSESGSADPTLVKGDPTLVKGDPTLVKGDPTLVKGIKEAETPATKTTKSTKSEKTGTASGSGIGSLFEDGSNGIIGGDSESGSADPTLVKGDPTLVKGSKETPIPIEITKAPVVEAANTTKSTKSTKSEKTGATTTSSIGSLFDDGSSGVIGSESGSADPTLVKAPPAEKTAPASKTKILPVL